LCFFTEQRINIKKKKVNMNWTGKIARFFVVKGRLSLLSLITLFAWGAISFVAAPKQYNPTITAPAFQVVVDYPGHTQSEVLEQITKPLENVISDIPGVEDIFSTTTQGGQSILTVNFFVGEDFHKAKIALTDRLRSDSDLAPLRSSAPQISTIDPDDVPVLTIAVSSDEIGPIELRKFAFRLRDRLRLIPGASRIEVVGGRKQELIVELDPKKLSRSGVSLDQITNALQKNNLFLPSGTIKGDEKYTRIETFGTVSKPGDIEDVSVVVSDAGEITVKDLAQVSLQAEENEDFVRHVKVKSNKVQEANNTVLLSVAKIKGTNISTVTQRVQKDIAKLRKSFIPNNISAKVIVDEGQKARSEINGLAINLITSISIVVLILFLFLDTKAALLVAVAIPLTLASVFGIALIAGQNINRITLFALILSLGLLVDNATVIIENIVRRLRKYPNKKKENVIPESVSEVGPGLFMSTITTVLAFVPMAFCHWHDGPVYGTDTVFCAHSTHRFSNCLLHDQSVDGFSFVKPKRIFTNKEQARLAASNKVLPAKWTSPL
jgi:multidrug efflux pump subunit AcrB